jgi:hypothetical protein
MSNKNLKNISKGILSITLVSVLASCGNPGARAPIMPERGYTVPQYTPSNSEFQATLPAGTKPLDMKVSGLSEDEIKKNEVSVPVGMIKQLYVDIKLDNNQVLKNYNAVKWTVSNSEIGSINTRGVFTPQREGRTRVTASVGGVAAVIDLVVTSSLNIWSQIISPTSRDLYSVKMVNDNEAWAVGQGGTIVHYINGNWIDETGARPVTTVDLTSVDTTQSGEAWAVGGSSIFKYSGGNWETVNANAGGTLRAIDMLSETEGWAVGVKADGDALVLKYSMGSWQPVESKIGDELNSVSALGPNDVWVGGKSRFMGSPAMYKFNGDKWSKARFAEDGIFGNIVSKVRPWDGTYEVKAVKMLNSSQGWAVGEYTPVLSTLRGKRGFIFKYDPLKDSWERGTFDKSINAELDQVPLRNIGMISASKGWALGMNVPPNRLFSKEVNDIPGSFLSCDGKNLKIDTQYQANTVGKSFFGIDILPNGNGVVVGAGGFIMQHQYDISRPNYYNNSGKFNNYNNYGSVGSYDSGSYSDGGY